MTSLAAPRQSRTSGLTGHLSRFAVDIVFFSIATWGIVLPCAFVLSSGSLSGDGTAVPVVAAIFFIVASSLALLLRWSHRALAALLVGFFVGRIAVALAIGPDPWHDAGTLWTESAPANFGGLWGLNIYQCYGLFFYLPLQAVFGSSYQLVPFFNSFLILLISGIIATGYSRTFSLNVMAATLSILNLAPVAFLMTGIAAYDLTGGFALLVLALCAMQLTSGIVPMQVETHVRTVFRSWPRMLGWLVATALAGIVLIYARLPPIAAILVVALLLVLRFAVAASDQTRRSWFASKRDLLVALLMATTCLVLLTAVWFATQVISPVCATKDGNTSGGLFRLAFEQPYTEGLYRYRFGQVIPTLGALDNDVLLGLWRRLLASAVAHDFPSFVGAYFNKARVLLSPGDFSIYFYGGSNPLAVAVRPLLNFLQSAQAGYCLVVFPLWIGGILTMRSFMASSVTAVEGRFFVLGLPFVGALFTGMVVIGGEVAARYYFPVFFLCAPLIAVLFSTLERMPSRPRHAPVANDHGKQTEARQALAIFGRELLWLLLIVGLPIAALWMTSALVRASGVPTFLSVQTLFASAPDLQSANEVAVDRIPITDPEKTDPPKPFGPYAVLLPVSLSTNWLAGEICGFQAGQRSISLVTGSVMGDRAAPSGYRCTLNVGGSETDCTAVPKRIVIKDLQSDERSCVPVTLRRSSGIWTAFFLGFVAPSRSR